MKLLSAITLFVALVTLGVQATPMPNSEADPLSTLEKRADGVCKVASNGVDCRSKPGVGAGVWIRDINTNDRFGVNCIKVSGGSTWDWIPGWGCWVSARDTRPADGRSSCESGISPCP